MTSTMISRISVKQFSLFLLLAFSLTSLAIILYATFNMHQAAIRAQVTTMEKVVEVAANEQMRQIHLKSNSFAQSISQRLTQKKLLDDYKRYGNTIAINRSLTDPLINGHSFSASLDVIWLRAYDLNFKLISESSTVSSSVISKLPAKIIQSLAKREGLERVKSYGALWQDNLNNSFYSIVVPIGGLRIKGYLEAVINPLFNLPNIENMVKMPIQISFQDGLVRYKSENKINKEGLLPVTFSIVDFDNQPTIKIIAYVNIESLESQSNDTRIKSLITLIVLTLSILVLAIWLSNYFLFKPLKIMLLKLDEYEKDSSVTLPNNGLLELHTLGGAFNRLLVRLHERSQELLRLSVLDALTGIANRRRFDDYIHQEWQRAIKTKQTLSLLLIDIDHFKLYNDFYGHQQGDFCLHQVANVIQDSLENDDDLAARYGGEEFAVVLPRTDNEEAQAIAQRMIKRLHKLNLKHGESPTNTCVTISLGIHSCHPKEGTDFDESHLIYCADQALYKAKEGGRDRFSVSNES